MANNNRAICTCILISMASLGGMSILIAWLADRTKSPSFTMARATVSGYALTGNNLLNATFALALLSHNRDPKYSITYQEVVVSVYHDGFTLAFDELGGPFRQAHGVDVTFRAQLEARNVSVHPRPGVVGEFNGGQLKVEVGVRAKLRFEVKGWKHLNYILKVICSPVFINLTSGSTKSFEGTVCN